jgi:TolB-like protein/DNA-binding winged helix-turn-helix (wHTH) protein/tetratricopeptide (TPR) repeat protein
MGITGAKDPGPVFELGRFRVDAHQRILVCDDKVVPLPVKTFDLLLALIENNGQVVSKDDLLKRVWPDTFVEETNLAKAIHLLRKTLGEGVIETFPKRGYRLNAPVIQAGAGAVVDIQEQVDAQVIIHEQTTPATRSIPTRLIWVAVSALVAVASAGIWHLASQRAAVRQHSLLVLPFADLSGDPAHEYFSDGLTEELIHGLSGVEGLRVVARTTAFQFKGKGVDVPDVARRLGVENVLEGAVRRGGGHLRIMVRLIRARDNMPFWSRTFDDSEQNVFAVQEDVAGAIVAILRPGQPMGGTRVIRTGTQSLEAYNLYLQGQFMRQKVAGPAVEKGLAMFQRATALDPSFAAAWAGQAISHYEFGYTYRKYPKEAYPPALEAVRHALKLAPKLAIAHAIIGKIALDYDRDWVLAKRELETAVALEPDNPEAHHWLSHYWVSLGNRELARQESLRALACDPLNLSIRAHQIFEPEEAGKYSEAIEAADQTLQLDPLHSGSLFYLTVAYERSGRLREAIGVRRRAGWNEPPPDLLERALAERGPSAYWRLRADSDEARRRTRPTRPVELARNYAFLGETSRALDWLEQGVEERDPWIVYMKYEPTFAGLRSHPRFRQIVKAAGIP